jgi:hypothetical protein
MSPFGSATLVLQGPTGRLKFELTGERTSVGRTRDNEIVLQDPAVSSHHCEFVADKTGLSIRDLNSSNGSYVNGRRVQAGPVYDGDTVKIGQFQGRIAVRNLEGKPLKAPGVAGPALIVGAIVLVVVIAAGAVGMTMMNKKDADRKLFDDYEHQAKANLSIEPCSTADDAVRRLRAIARNLTPPDLGKRGKLSKDQKQKDEDILGMSKRREPLVDAILKEVGAIAEKQKAGIGELRGFQGKFNDAELAGAAKALESVFAERGQASEEFADQWKKYGAQVAEYNGLLGKLVNTGDKDAADQLDGWTFRLEPEKLLEECQAKFGKTQQDGLLKLAGVAL